MLTDEYWCYGNLQTESKNKVIGQVGVGVG